jgi:bacteriocin biosynthesis cyclodehydratase domain-containing protein
MVKPCEGIAARIYKNPAVHLSLSDNGFLSAYTPSGIVRLHLDEAGEVRCAVEDLVQHGSYVASVDILNTSFFHLLADRGIIQTEDSGVNDVLLSAFAYPARLDLGKQSVVLSNERGHHDDVAEKLEKAGVNLVAHNAAGSDAIELCFCLGVTEFARDRNRAAHTDSRTILFVMDYLTFIRVGPLVTPSESSCLECLYWRGRAGAHNETTWLELSDVTALTPTSSYVMRLHELIGTIELLKYLCQGRASTLENSFRDISLRSWTTSTHHLLRLPNCPVCGSRMETG